MKILVTGASGFVGQRFLEFNKNLFEIISISLQNDEWQHKEFGSFDAVVHLAGKAHQMQKIDDKIYYEVNYDLTKRFYEKIKKDGVQQFIYISSTKVYGDGEYDNLNETSICNPTDAYGKSKLQAEKYLLNQKDTIITIIRPPLVYGPYVKGNMKKIMELCNSNKPLPFAKIYNKRSMVFVDNLIALINTTIIQKKSGVFVAGDNETISTTTLVTAIKKELGKKNNFFSIPILLRSLIKKLKPTLYTRLFGSFYVNNNNTNTELNFTPPHTFSEGIAKMVQQFKTK